MKLQLRRSANQLAEQNILPRKYSELCTALYLITYLILAALKTSPAIHEQRRLLERAKAGDLLKTKILQRPNRQELERRHILDDFSGKNTKFRFLRLLILIQLYRPCRPFISREISNARESYSSGSVELKNFTPTRYFST